ncbi:hypothetical protein PHYSODRAFT_325376 [Phytophthora sojae]|uniref:BED-type domain-containing protein n=1 Tax=Phytophthora sojae (strain P6497) TaxID=1094619 RepID=G4YTK9_PHYSP|nr:hypothetical protein PHYSODRAFT_325376 [Phytophthora sojae]EGZ24237.1 hypothetical protein PHYSODRAFT_325376 [Phytophthora sojae]|eukprot:XP_009519525.1 hypothetical protein PHYSODRAFT_325376 [Phytophthora sojae]
MSTRVTQAELRTLERAFKDLHFDCNVTWVSLSEAYSITRISDNRVTLASVLDEFFGGIYRAHGTDVKRVSDERFAEYEGRPFSVCFADLLEVVCENEDTRAAYNTQVSNVTWEPQSAKPRRDAFVRLHMCYTNTCGRRPQYALEKIWAHVLQCDSAVKSAIEVYKPGMSDPLEVVYLTPVDDDDPIIYPPPERSQGLFSDDYDWIPDGICGMYLIDGGTTGNYLIDEPGMFCVEKLGMSDEFWPHDRNDKAFVEAAEKEFRQRMGKLNLGWIYSDATDHDKKELIRCVPQQLLTAFLFDHLGQGLFRCKLCDQDRKQMPGSGYSNLLAHLAGKHEGFEAQYSFFESSSIRSLQAFGSVQVPVVLVSQPAGQHWRK